MHRIFWALLAAFLAVWIVPAHARDRVWLPDDLFDSLHVVVNERATDMERFAAGKFATFWEESTGHRVTTGTRRKFGKTNVWIGSIGNRYLGRGDLQDLGEHGFIIHTHYFEGKLIYTHYGTKKRTRKVRSRHLSLAGAGERGILCAVYRFFEDFMRFSWIGAADTQIPAPPANIPSIDLRHECASWQEIERHLPDPEPPIVVSVNAEKKVDSAAPVSAQLDAPETKVNAAKATASDVVKVRALSPEQETVAQVSPSQPTSKPSKWRGVGKNILHNSGFEQASSRPFAWWIEDRNPEGVLVSAETAAPYKGERSVKVKLPANVIVGIYQRVADLIPGKTYFVSGYIKTENYIGNAGIEVHDIRGYEVFAAGSASITGTQDWTGAQVDFTVPEGTEKLNIVLRGGGDRDGMDTPGTIWFDNVKLYRAMDEDGAAN